MKDLKNIMYELTMLLDEIESTYPDLYSELNDKPVTIPVVNHPFIDKNILYKYLSSLKRLLNQHKIKRI